MADIYTVSDLNSSVRQLIETNIPLVWVTGELSNIARPASGHIYFTLKDELAQVRCAMFRMRNTPLGFAPNNGMQVLVRAKVSLYEARGDYQLIIEHMEAAGDGLLRQRYEATKKRLDIEGLFDESHKQMLPVLPRRIGVITSPSGAAIRDILSVLKRRFPSIPILIYPVPVQGEGAAEQIAVWIKQACQSKACDVLVVSRGGGSLEDLWAFNEECVARAIYRCSIPVVTGIGHETDFTIADFVADQRAATPSAAAELVSPDRGEWLVSLQRIRGRLVYMLRTQLQRNRETLASLAKRLRHPQQRLESQAQRLDELEQRLCRGQHLILMAAKTRLTSTRARLRQQSPQRRLIELNIFCQALSKRLHLAIQHVQNKRQTQLAGLTRALDAISPLATLARGYAIVKKPPNDVVVHRASELNCDDLIETQLHKGSFIAKVTKIRSDPRSSNE